MIAEYAQEGARLRLSTFEQYAKELERVGILIMERISAGHTLFLCGNGGSAAEAQHIAAEYIGRFSKRERKSLPAIALTTDTSIITALANDYSFDIIFERQIEGLGKQGDILIASSTSGNSRNCIRAIQQAKSQGIYTIAFTGKGGGTMGDICDVLFAVDSLYTPLTQEIHLAMQHILCTIAENALPQEYDRAPRL